MSTATQPKPSEEKPNPKTLPAAPGAAAEASFLARMTGKKPEAKPQAATPPAAKQPDDGKKKEGDETKSGAAPAAPASPTPPAPQPKRKPAAAPMPIPPPDVDPEAIATAAATAAVAAIKKGETPATPKTPQDQYEGLDDDEKETIQVLERMEADFGDSYKNLPKRYAESLKKAKNYQKDWEAKNPGQKFNPEDDEHNEFFDANEVDWKDMDFNRALARIENDKVLSKEKAKDDREKSELAARNRILEEKPVVERRRRETAKTLFAALGDDYKAVINEDGSINSAEVKRLIDEDPLREITFDAASRTEQFAEDLHLLYSGLVKFNEKNQNHAYIANFVEQQEKAMIELPAAQQLNDIGQRFATSEQYQAMTPARRAYYWRFTDKDIAELYAEFEASEAKNRIAEEENRVLKAAERRGLKKVEAAPGGQGAGVGGEPPQAPPVEKPVSPEGTVAPREAQPASGGAGGGKNATKDFLSRWIGK